ncbi:MAG: S49 family peptidase [Sphingobacteriaceae bacterium]|nr:S49 family peptidase [Sphingobacteriaceae bacterium]
MFNSTLSAILRGAWLIDQQFAESHLPLVLGMLQGKVSGSEFLSGSAESEQPFILNSKNKRVDPYRYNRESRQFEIDERVIEAGSVAVIPVIGPVLKYNGSCGEPGMVKRQGWVSDLMSLPQMEGMISFIDSPGGQADGTPQFTDFVRYIDKPTIALIEGGAYSAGAWIASGHKAIYAANKHASTGSIGAYTTIVNHIPYFEKQGYQIKTYYPAVSKDKNKSFRDAIQGNDELILEEIAELAMSFISNYAENRSGKLTSDEWNTGKVFNYQDSVRIGLIDGIRSLSEAAQEIRGGKIFSASLPPVQNSTTLHTSKMEIKNLVALATAQTEQVDNLIQDANGDLKDAGITTAILVETGFLESAEQASKDVTRLTEELATANTSLSNLNTSLTEVQGKFDTATAELATANATIADLQGRLSKLPGGVHNSEQGAANDTPPAGEEIDYQAQIDNLPHNKNADKVLGTN